MTTYSVSRRRREIGIRVALGADGLSQVAWILRQGIRLAAVGLAAGLGPALLLTRLIQGLLHGVDPLDPLSLAAATLVLLAAATAACLLPALRAVAVDPLEVLREE